MIGENLQFSVVIRRSSHEEWWPPGRDWDRMSPMTGATGRSRDVAAVAAGALRLASGVSFLVAPKGAHKLWAGSEDFGPTVSLLLRSMGYRDALIGGLLLQAGLRGRPTAGWFLASAGADTADLVGGLTNHAQMTREQRGRGYAGAVVGIAVGLLGAGRDAIR